MKVLVTGGAGFIGFHLCDYLLKRGDWVSVIDDLSTVEYDNIGHLEKNERFTLIIDTIFNKPLVEELVRSVDVIYHLASAVGVKLIISQPVRTIETIIEGTNIVLSQARRYRKKVLITSSSEVYGKGSKFPFSEQDDVVLGPTTTRRWAYGASKGIVEFLAFAHWYETKLPVICVRLFNTVGPGQIGNYGMVIPNFIQQATQGKDIVIYGSGEQTRSFCHVSDAVSGLVDLMNCDDAIGKVINIGSDEEVTINHLAERVKILSKSSSQIIHIPYKKAYMQGFEDMLRRVPDISLAKNLIGFEPEYNLDDILKSILKVWVGLEDEACSTQMKKS